MCIPNDTSCYVLFKSCSFFPMCYVEIGETLVHYHAIMCINDLQLANVDFEVVSKIAVDYFREVAVISKNLESLWMLVFILVSYFFQTLVYLKTNE